MNTFLEIKNHILTALQSLFALPSEKFASIEVQLNVDKEPSFGDVSCNAAMVLARELKQNPRQLAQQIQKHFELFEINGLGKVFEKVDIAGPGFLNFTFVGQIWKKIASEIYANKSLFFALSEHEKNYNTA
ncbi:MAG: hypothetical protein V1855_03870 [bacterium]